MSKTDIILVNYNGAHDTIMCIESLWQMKQQNFRVIVVENGSTDKSEELLSEFISSHQGNIYQEADQSKASSSDLILIIAKSNRGFAAGNNLGMKLSLQSTDIHYVWLLNNDTIVDQDALGALTKAHTRYKEDLGNNPGIIGSKVKFYHDKDIIQAVGGIFSVPNGKVKLIGFNERDTGQYDAPQHHYDMVLGASMFVDIDFIKEVGMLNEDYFLYSEELDWSHRAKKYNFSTRYEPASVVYHKQGQATGNNVFGKKNEFAMYHIYRSLLIFYRTYYPRYIYKIKCRIVVRLIKFQLKGQLNAWPVFYKIFLKR